ncbi:MAG: hypothetical protein KAS65_05465, partial [Candidatus Aminicenantes bacterium]|nr:hypothetical protein [Candidatus Aminicenantes bacterium]
QEVLYGDMTRRDRSEPYNTGIMGRLGNIIYGYWKSSSAPTRTMYRQLEIVEESLEPLRVKLDRLIKTDLQKLFREAEKARVPWTPGRITSDTH